MEKVEIISKSNPDTEMVTKIKKKIYNKYEKALEDNYNEIINYYSF